MKLSTLTFILVGVLSSNVSAQAKYPDKKAYYGNILYGYIGCFNDKGGLKQHSSHGFMTNGMCRGNCKEDGYTYAGTSKNGQCWCGDKLPSKDAILDNGDCDKPCQGYGEEPCGSNKGLLTITLVDEMGDDPRLYDGDGDGENGEDASDKPGYKPPTSTSTSSKPTAASTVVQEGTTVTVMPTADNASDTATPEEEEEETEDGGLNKAGLAAGVVVGVLLAAAAGVGAFVYVRRQKQKKVEEDYRRNLATMEYGVKKPESDMRLDPVMLQRRMSDGSIADNQDYSRRILKVTNPDGN